MLISCGSGSIFFFCGCEYALLCASAPYTAVAWLKSISVSEFRLLIVNDELVWWIFFLFHFCCRCCCVINCRYLECELTEGSDLCSGWRRFFFCSLYLGTDEHSFKWIRVQCWCWWMLRSVRAWIKIENLLFIFEWVTPVTPVLSIIYHLSSPICIFCVNNMFFSSSEVCVSDVNIAYHQKWSNFIQHVSIALCWLSILRKIRFFCGYLIFGAPQCFDFERIYRNPY